MKKDSGNTSQRVEDYPKYGFLAGYFFIRDIERKTAGPKLGFWKNSDFLRLKDFALHLLNPKPGDRIIDVGCGEGATMVYCGLQRAEVFGQDLNANSVAVANEALRDFGIQGEARCGDATQMDFPDNSFDGAIANDFFEHIDVPTKIAVLKEMRRVLKPGAPAVIRTPNLNYLRVSLWYKRLRAVVRFKSPFGMVIPHTPGTDLPEHIGLTTRRELTHCMLEAGFVNYEFHYAPLRRFGTGRFMELLSSEIPVIRDWLSEDLVARTYKPITLSHFPD